MKITNELVNKYERLIHKMLQNKYNLINYENYEDLVQEGRCLIIEGLRSKYNPERGSVCTFLYLYLNSKFDLMNRKKKNIFGYSNMKNRRFFITRNSVDVDQTERIHNNLNTVYFKSYEKQNDGSEILRNIQIRSVISKLSKNKQSILKDLFVLRMSLKEIAKKMGKKWSVMRVKMEAEKIRGIFRENV